MDPVPAFRFWRKALRCDPDSFAPSSGAVRSSENPSVRANLWLLRIGPHHIVLGKDSECAAHQHTLVVP
jgi:hypothetical protein